MDTEVMSSFTVAKIYYITSVGQGLCIGPIGWEDSDQSLINPTHRHDTVAERHFAVVKE